MGIFPTLLAARKRLERRAEDVMQDMNCNDIYVSAPVEPGWPGYKGNSGSSSGDFSDFSSPRSGQFGYGSKSGSSRSSSSGFSGHTHNEPFQQQQQGFFYNPNNKSQLSVQSDPSPYGYGHSSSARGWPDQEQQKSSLQQQLQFKCSTDSGWIVVDTRLKQEDPVSARQSTSPWRSPGATSGSSMHRSCSFRG